MPGAIPTRTLKRTLTSRPRTESDQSDQFRSRDEPRRLCGINAIKHPDHTAIVAVVSISMMRHDSCGQQRNGCTYQRSAAPRLPSMRDRRRACAKRAGSRRPTEGHAAVRVVSPPMVGSLQAGFGCEQPEPNNGACCVKRFVNKSGIVARLRALCFASLSPVSLHPKAHRALLSR